MFWFSSTFLLAVITLQRYLKVCRPFGPQFALKWRRISLLLIFVLSVTVSAPFIIMREQLSIPNIELNVTGYMCGINIMKVDQNAYRTFIFYPSFIIVGVMLELIILNVLIGRQMIIASKMFTVVNNVMRMRTTNAQMSASRHSLETNFANINSVSMSLAETDLEKTSNETNNENMSTNCDVTERPMNTSITEELQMKSYISWSLLLYILAVESCNNDQFQCTNGQCVLLKFRCDDSFECNDKSDEVNLQILSSSVTRHFPTLYTSAQSSSKEHILFKTSPTSRGNPLRSYTTSKDMHLSRTNEKVVFNFTTSKLKDVKVETTSTPLKQLSDTSVKVVAIVLSSKIVKPFNKETSLNIVFLNSTVSTSIFPSSSYQLNTLLSKSRFEFEREKYVSYYTLLQSSLQTVSRSYIIGLSYDYSQSDSSIDDKTKIYRPTELSYSPLYLLYSSLNVKH
ncbi:unnamed protein product [Mytilus coruscus]|uniref:G-protein coupled receptors family 1 profile domain-containing protein n=1 Tax=Mytilus coruscus TaxID=42192 RepID=A0A6J8EP78_MYTCO|nr:unnamed protein product [Mytilus coruscus]